ncbi:AcrR family transcriptional regulator [Streptosporangium becharense]|uniref:AcrR family transcriptional regulator n=2 Tax=Streptosporangium becharense TaxID=1816182 RepID=A0A7W9MFS8_9ACTN|nr:AcrR family transcriptional regulator [Streptosporangium becharense]
MMRKGLTRQATIDAAIAYADRHGLDALSISALARHLGVAAPSLYVHLPGGLRELRAALCARGHLDIAERCRRAATGRSGADALRALAHAQRDYARDHPALYAATGLAIDGHGGDEVRRAADEAAAVAADVLATGAFAESSRVHAARGIRSAVQGFCALEAAGMFALDVSVDESFSWLVEALVSGAMSPVEAGTADRS